MTFYELSKLRNSVRNYTDATVADTDLNYILETARLAPSAVNLQPWKFIVAQTVEAKEKVRKCYHREWFNNAPLYIICVIEHSQSWKRPSDSKDHGDIDIAIAAEHICLAAAEKGLGSCWVCNFDANLAHNLFNLSDDEEVAVIIPIGHFPTDYVAKEKQRKPLSEIVEYV